MGRQACTGATQPCSMLNRPSQPYVSSLLQTCLAFLYRLPAAQHILLACFDAPLQQRRSAAICIPRIRAIYERHRCLIFGAHAITWSLLSFVVADGIRYEKIVVEILIEL